MLTTKSLLFVCLSIILAAFDATPQERSTKPADLKAALKEIDAATPKTLPQSPVVSRSTTDAQELHFKGKVKGVFEESKNVSSPQVSAWRQLNSYSEFNADGNLVRVADFYWGGKGLSQVRVYGYLDGKRVSFVKPSKVYGRWGPVGEPDIQPKEKSNGTKDERYEFAYEYKYEDGRLIEKQLFANDGRKQNRIVFTHTKDQVEHRKYLPNGELNDRYIYIYDENGNEIEQLSYRRGPGQDFAEFSTYEYVYDRFDSEGNWTERSVYSVTIEPGKKKAELIRTEYRTIEYFK